MALESKLVKLLIVKAAENRRQATECPDQPELRGDEVNDKTEPHASAQTRDHARLRACTSASGSPAARRFVFRWVQLVRRKSEVTDLVCGLERATQQIAACPGHVSSRA